MTPPEDPFTRYLADALWLVLMLALAYHLCRPLWS